MSVTKSSTIKGSISRIENGRIAYIYDFQMNPEELVHSRKAKWIRMNAPGTVSGRAQFVNTPGKSIPLKLLVSSESSQNYVGEADILRHIEEMDSWTLPAMDPFLNNQTSFIAAPQLIFTYGPRTWLCTCDGVSIKELVHNNALLPLTAEVTIELVTHQNNINELRSMIQQKQNFRDIGFG